MLTSVVHQDLLYKTLLYITSVHQQERNIKKIETWLIHSCASVSMLWIHAGSSPRALPPLSFSTEQMVSQSVNPEKKPPHWITFTSICLVHVGRLARHCGVSVERIQDVWNQNHRRNKSRWMSMGQPLWLQQHIFSTSTFLFWSSSCTCLEALSQWDVYGGPRPGCHHVVWGHGRFPYANSDMGAVPRPPAPRRHCPWRFSNAALRHSSWVGLLQLHCCQQCGEPSQEKRQPRR